LVRSEVAARLALVHLASATVHTDDDAEVAAVARGLAKAYVD
jgi:hypothetical protein